jgi:hypothetical protein
VLVSEAAYFLIGPGSSWFLRSLPESRVANGLPIPRALATSERLRTVASRYLFGDASGSKDAFELGEMGSSVGGRA